MLRKINQALTAHKSLLLLLLAILFYLGLTLPALLDADHVMKNLEPYPDGILFSLSARNLSLGRGLKLSTDFGQVRFWVPPLYALYLSCFYFFSKSVTVFYLANLSLGFLTIITLYLIVKKISSSIWPLLAAFLIYFSHIVIFWFPSLAMSENLSLFLFALLFLGLLEKETKLKLVVTSLAALGLILTKFSAFPLAVAALLIMFCQKRKIFFKYPWQFLTLFLLSLALLLYLLQASSFELFRSNIFTSLLNPNFFNPNFIAANLKSYFIAMLFNRGNFLWLQIGISNWAILGMFLLSIYKLFKTKQSQEALILLTLFIALLPLQLLFYVADARYLIQVILIFAIAAAYLTNLIKNKKLILIFILLAMLINIFYQKMFLKQLLADNLLGRSSAWQQQAILHFNKNLQADDMIITALPPFLIDAYQNKNYRALPLSNKQEFLQKKIYVWGDNLNYADLISNYKEMLQNGDRLYISNSYVTHQASVIADFEKYKQEFELELISEGCQQSCNIYKLHVKNIQE